MEKSKMLRAALGADVVDHYLHTARWEQLEYDRRVTDWELKRGFEKYIVPSPRHVQNFIANAFSISTDSSDGRKGNIGPHP